MAQPIIQVSKRDIRRLKRGLGKLPFTLQKKVLRETIRRVNREVVLPAVKEKIKPRSFDPPVWNAVKGIGPAHMSHDKRPGILRDKMTVRSIKRTRTAVGSVVVTPTRKQLGIPEWSLSFYPAALEYQKSQAFGNAPRPYMRGTLRDQRGNIERAFVSIARKRMKTVFKGRR